MGYRGEHPDLVGKVLRIHENLKTVRRELVAARERLERVQHRADQELGKYAEAFERLDEAVDHHTAWLPQKWHDRLASRKNDRDRDLG